MIVFTLDTETRLEFYFKDGISMKDLLKFEKKYLKLMDDNPFDKAKYHVKNKVFKHSTKEKPIIYRYMKIPQELIQEYYKNNDIPFEL